MGEHAPHHARRVRAPASGEPTPCWSTPFDSAIPGGWPGIAASFARRMARNTQLLLLEESHIGRVLDPAAAPGSSRTSPGRSPRRRGSTSATSNPAAVSSTARDYLAAQIAEVSEQRSDDIAHRRTALTGVNEYPNLAEVPLPHADPNPRCAALRGGFRGAAGPLRCVSRRARIAADRAAAAARPARRTQHPHHVRREPAGLRRYRGRQPRHRRRGGDCAGGRGCRRRRGAP